MTPDPVPDPVWRAVRSIPAQRDTDECPCSHCFEERAREKSAADWRALRSGQ